MKEKNNGKQNSSKRKLTKKQVYITIFSVIMISLILVGGGYLYVRGKIYRKSNYATKPTNDVQTPVKPKEETVEYNEVKGITNILLIGADGIDFDSKDQRSDSMIIATLDNNNKKIKLTSLYRDAIVFIPGYGESKMNAAFSLGGPELVMETINYNFDLKLEKYVMLNFVGFEAIIDQIGGIEIDVQEYQLNELNKYIGEATGGNDCPVEEAGLQLLNGKQALSYARIRKGVGDDYERTERQREVLFKVAEKLKDTKPSKYLGIMNKMLNYVRTNIEPIECLNMAYTIFKFPSLDTEQLSIPVPELCIDENLPGGGSGLRMDRYENAVILNDFIFNDYLPDFILNRNTEKDPSIYYEYDGFGGTVDDSYYYEDYNDYYEEDYVEDEIIEDEVIEDSDDNEYPEDEGSELLPDDSDSDSEEVFPPEDGEENTDGEIEEETETQSVDEEESEPQGRSFLDKLFNRE